MLEEAGTTLEVATVEIIIITSLPPSHLQRQELLLCVHLPSDCTPWRASGAWLDQSGGSFRRQPVTGQANPDAAITKMRTLPIFKVRASIVHLHGRSTWPEANAMHLQHTRIPPHAVRMNAHVRPSESWWSVAVRGSLEVNGLPSPVPGRPATLFRFGAVNHEGLGGVLSKSPQTAVPLDNYLRKDSGDDFLFSFGDGASWKLGSGTQTASTGANDQ